MMADQLVGDVVERFIQQVSSGRIPGVNLRTCLYEIAYSFLVLDVRYKDYFVTADGSFLRHPERSTLELGTNDQRLFSAIQRALFYDLTDDQRHVLLLRFVEGFSLKETAAITGKKVNNVKVIQNRAITALRKAVKTAARKRNAAEALALIDVESCGKSRINLGGLAEDLHRRNVKQLFREVMAEENELQPAPREASSQT